ncbi:zf-HC2 domain-containing protein [Methylocucumis oryzae]|uniref:zf-HC2 domain-containing protein n=1 Tax=Methylocucumis oryzae TaxID=1632867 RepID=UPI0009E42248|nr:zf-HC2 domain-containing protein [Methylocucumis oryzae]
MLSCRDITALISKGLDKKLSVSQRLAIGFHLMLCTHCRNFQNQSQFLRKAAHRYTEQLQKRLDKKS